MASGQPTSIDSPDRPGIDRSTIPTTRSRTVPPGPDRERHLVADPQPEASGETGGDDRRAALVEGGERGGPVARR